MQLLWVTWQRVLFLSGVLILSAYGADKEDTVSTVADPPNYSDNEDYPDNYDDYSDRDYPSPDYYGNNRGRSLTGDSSGNDIPDPMSDEEHFLKQLQSTIPGVPGVDYSLYQSVPETSFKCESQRNPGFYGDVEAQCQVFHICQEDNRHDSFICPVGTVFNQMNFVCDWWFNFKCENTPAFFHLNAQFEASTPGSAMIRDAMNKMRRFRETTSNEAMPPMMRAVVSTMTNGDAYANRAMPKVKGRRMDRIMNLFSPKMRSHDIWKRLEATTELDDGKDGDSTTAVSSENATKPLSRKEHINPTTTSSGNFEYTSPEHPTTLLPNTELSSSDESRSTSVEYSTPVVTDEWRDFENTPNSAMELKEFLENAIEITHPDRSVGGEREISVTLKELTTTPVLNSTENISLGDMHVDITSEKILEELIPMLHESGPNTTETFFPHFEENSIDRSELEREISDHDRENDIGNTVKSTENPSVVPQMTVSVRPLSNSSLSPRNETHISVSVTIRATAGISRLKWRRIPEVRRYKQSPLKAAPRDASADEPDISPMDPIFIKKMIANKKPKSRIMWIPAKNNTLSRRNYWRIFVNAMPQQNIISNVTKRKGESEIQSAELSKDVMTPINIQGGTSVSNTEHAEETTVPANTDPPETTLNTESSEMTLTVMVPSEPSISYSNTVSKSDNALSGTGENQVDARNTKICQVFCAKLLESVEATSMTSLVTDNTLYESASNDYAQDPKTNYAGLNYAKLLESVGATNMTSLVTDNALHESSSNDYAYVPKTNLKIQMGRRSFLGVSPPEEWTVKHDPSPDCNGDSENGNVLVRGWSVIIDSGLVTKEKTVKRRGCQSIFNDSKIIVMQNKQPSHHSVTKGGTRRPKEESKITFGSMDQQYWLSLVKNWLDASPDSKKGSHTARSNPPRNDWNSNQQEQRSIDGTNFLRPRAFRDTAPPPNLRSSPGKWGSGRSFSGTQNQRVPQKRHLGGQRSQYDLEDSSTNRNANLRNSRLDWSDQSRHGSQQQSGRGPKQHSPGHANKNFASARKERWSKDWESDIASSQSDRKEWHVDMESNRRADRKDLPDEWNDQPKFFNQNNPPSSIGDDMKFRPRSGTLDSSSSENTRHKFARATDWSSSTDQRKIDLPNVSSDLPFGSDENKRAPQPRIRQSNWDSDKTYIDGWDSQQQSMKRVPTNSNKGSSRDSKSKRPWSADTQKDWDSEQRKISSDWSDKPSRKDQWSLDNSRRTDVVSPSGSSSNPWLTGKDDDISDMRDFADRSNKADWSSKGKTRSDDWTEMKDPSWSDKGDQNGRNSQDWRKKSNKGSDSWPASEPKGKPDWNAEDMQNYNDWSNSGEKKDDWSSGSQRGKKDWSSNDRQDRSDWSSNGQRGKNDWSSNDQQQKKEWSLGSGRGGNDWSSEDRQVKKDWTPEIPQVKKDWTPEIPQVKKDWTSEDRQVKKDWSSEDRQVKKDWSSEDRQVKKDWSSEDRQVKKDWSSNSDARTDDWSSGSQDDVNAWTSDGQQENNDRSTNSKGGKRSWPTSNQKGTRKSRNKGDWSSSPKKDEDPPSLKRKGSDVMWPTSQIKPEYTQDTQKDISDWSLDDEDTKSDDWSSKKPKGKPDWNTGSVKSKAEEKPKAGWFDNRRMEEDKWSSGSQGDIDDGQQFDEQIQIPWSSDDKEDKKKKPQIQTGWSSNNQKGINDEKFRGPNPQTDWSSGPPRRTPKDFMRDISPSNTWSSDPKETKNTFPLTANKGSSFASRGKKNLDSSSVKGSTPPKGFQDSSWATPSDSAFASSSSKGKTSMTPSKSNPWNTDNRSKGFPIDSPTDWPTNAQKGNPYPAQGKDSGRSSRRQSDWADEDSQQTLDYPSNRRDEINLDRSGNSMQRSDWPRMTVNEKGYRSKSPTPRSSSVGSEEWSVDSKANTDWSSDSKETPIPSSNKGSSWKQGPPNPSGVKGQDSGASQSRKGGTKTAASASRGRNGMKPSKPWKDEMDPPVNNDKGDSSMKEEKIVWSVQISSDGEPGSGWRPITLRPDLKNRGNQTKTDGNQKGSSMGDEDWPDPTDSWSNKGSSGVTTNPLLKMDAITETVPSSSEFPDASDHQSFYIPAVNGRFKRDNRFKNRTSSIKPTNTGHRIYRVIKNGKEVTGVERNEDHRFYLTSADILVDGDSSNKIDSRKPVLRKEFNETIKNSVPSLTELRKRHIKGNNSVLRNETKSEKSKMWDNVMQQSEKQESWSEPLNDSNVPASGWIPLFRVKKLPKHFPIPPSLKLYFQSNGTKQPDLNDSAAYVEVSNGTGIVDSLVFTTAKEQSPGRSSTWFKSNMSVNTRPHEFINTSFSVDSEVMEDMSNHEQQMRVGNKTFRIIPFSDVMKQLDTRRNESSLQDTKLENAKSSESLTDSKSEWNVPIEASPKTYSLKFIDESEMQNRNLSSSWTFANRTSKGRDAWILVKGSENKTSQTEDKTANTSSLKPGHFVERNNTVYKIIVGNRTREWDESNPISPTKVDSSKSNAKQREEHLPAMTTKEKASAKHQTGHNEKKEFSFDLKNWHIDSSWTPLLRSVGSVTAKDLNRSQSKNSGIR